ncbi:hypothetical protein INT43_006079 [Umbelopsis isabellina]|uniref:Cwf15/Cwc15 cell cycle control protein n=1 Tax=Mortierella isabellina TaxID=91625 RepID=A0A8H7PJA2_MORIS|nr:hypothetical protein INT43_006079 [Umbelopsis isabellina]
MLIQVSRNRLPQRDLPLIRPKVVTTSDLHFNGDLEIYQLIPNSNSGMISRDYVLTHIITHINIYVLNRQPGQGTSDEIADRELLKEELRRAEQEHYEAAEREMGGFVSSQRRALQDTDDTEDPEERRQRLLAEAEKLAALDKDDSDDSSSDDDSDEDDDDDDDDDNTAELLAELEKIKKERAEEKERQERQRQEEAEAAQEEQAMTGNPLLELGEKRDFSVKRRWDDDVIFKNQARGVDEKPKKRFINDTLRSDFHRRFLGKYIR